MQYFNELLNEEVSKIKEEIHDLDSELKRIKFDSKVDNEQKDIKIETLEKINLEAVNELEDVANSV